MLKSIPFFQFAPLLFDTEDLARKATVILKAILEAQSPRLSEIAQKMPGKPAANYSGGKSSRGDFIITGYHRRHDAPSGDSG